MQRRTAFFISDRTGITAEMLGHSLLTQFDGIELEEVTIPFIDSLEKARETAARIDRTAVKDGARPVIFSTLVNPKISAIVSDSKGLFVDCFQVFIAPLEAEFGIRSSLAVGRAHTAGNINEYRHRIDAVNYALAHDDGISLRELDQADVILIGVSRCGKTPTCLYMALQYGIRTANYPLVPEDLAMGAELPAHLKPVQKKIYGLTIEPERLSQIRAERRPDSDYAALANCRHEVRQAEALMRREGVPYLDTTTKSIEELATKILHQANLVRHIY